MKSFYLQLSTFMITITITLSLHMYRGSYLPIYIYLSIVGIETDSYMPRKFQYIKLLRGKNLNIYFFSTINTTNLKSSGSDTSYTHRAEVLYHSSRCHSRAAAVIC